MLSSVESIWSSPALRYAARSTQHAVRILPDDRRDRLELGHVGAGHQVEERELDARHLDAATVHLVETDLTVRRGARADGVGDDLDLPAEVRQIPRGLPDADMGLDSAEKDLVACGPLELLHEVKLADGREADLLDRPVPFAHRFAHGDCCVAQ